MEKEEKVVWGCAAVIVAIVVLCLMAQPYFEMRAFNKFSKTKAYVFRCLSVGIARNA